MAISEENKKFIESLIDYYTSVTASYKQTAESFVPEVVSVVDATFGIIVGNIYSEFIQAYQSQNIQVSVDDIQEFNKIMKGKAHLIKKAILEETFESSEDTEKKNLKKKK